MTRDFYANVPAEQRDALMTFRQNHPLQRVTLDGTDWTYIHAGSGEKVILWLVGGLKKADAAYKTIPMMQGDYRIIAPDYPELSSMDALADGIASLLHLEGVRQVNVLAGSFGGMLAQVFVRRHPQRVSKLVLSTTTPPSQAQAENYAEQLRMVQAAEEATVAEGAKMQMFSTMAPADAEADFWHAYLDELYTERLSKDDLTSLYKALIDFMKRDFSAEDLANFAGEILIIDSADDATFGSVREAMYALYPMAQVHSFQNAGHSPGNTQREAFFTKVREFFA